jgi:hypothetical protein
MYTVIYRYLSPVAHLNIEALNVVVTKSNQGNYDFNEGDGGKTYVVDAVGICVAYIKDLYENKVIEGKVPDAVLSLEQKLGEAYR